jgi:hypothetical protein
MKQCNQRILNIDVIRLSDRKKNMQADLRPLFDSVNYDNEHSEEVVDILMDILTQIEDEK